MFDNKKMLDMAELFALISTAKVDYLFHCIKIFLSNFILRVNVIYDTEIWSQIKQTDFKKRNDWDLTRKKCRP